MEFTKQEVEIVGQTIADAQHGVVSELSELQLVLIGGGIGEVIFT